ncbi:unnamed protein product [Schistocephalus solidus]|uniref:Uncharacterized protein n=1 Tax=Schistocephalus solidus TaxID=70667 RepID=A0A183SYP2_SCHSO|nr:unnamed protein product [Schistocephalus solidus]
MLLWPPLTGTQLSPVAPRSWVLPSGHTPGNRHDRRAKPAQGMFVDATVENIFGKLRSAPRLPYRIGQTFLHLCDGGYFKNHGCILIAEAWSCRLTCTDLGLCFTSKARHIGSSTDNLI